jgi:hypothetical protein
LPPRGHSLLGKKCTEMGGYIRVLVGKKDGQPYVTTLFGSKMWITGLRKDRVKKQVAVAEKNGRPVIGSLFPNLYRDDAPNMDELLSTATVNDFLKGYFERNPTNKPYEIEWMNTWGNMVSNLRIPTKFSGFALKGIVMQHPTNPKTALFAEANKTSKVHAAYDLERRNYVVKAMEDARENKKGPDEIIKSMMRAAIEYTLNNFTAPILASNVFDNTRAYKLGKKQNDTVLLEQVKSRELMKILYQQLNGVLQQKISGETDPLRRSWPGRVIRTSAPEYVQTPLNDVNGVNVPALPERPPSPLRMPQTEIFQ